MNLDSLFNPNSIALIGASNNPLKWGFIILGNILSGGYKGRIYPVNKKEKEILGLKVYPDLESIQDDVDLAMIVIPAVFVPDALKECAKKKVKSAIVVSGDFSEAGNPAKELEIVNIAKSANIDLVGPNTMGIFSGNLSLCALMPPVRPKKGIISFVAQSGNVGTQLLMQGENIGFNKFVCSGNEAYLHTEDYIEYFGEDDTTKVILAYIEGIRDGRKFFDVAKKVTNKKPIIVFKAGKTKAGSRAAKSHSAALAGEDKIYDAVFRQCGIIRAETPDEMLDLGQGFSKLPLPKGNRVGILTWGGGWGVVSADFCEEQGLEVINLPQEIVEKLNKLLPPYWSKNNPVDLVAFLDREAHLKCFDILASCDKIDAILALGIVAPSSKFISYPAESMKPFGEMMIKSEAEFVTKISKLQEEYNKPVISVEMRLSPEYRSEKLAIYDTPYKAVKVLSKLVEYKKYLERRESTEEVESEKEKRDKMDIIETAIKKGQNIISEYQAKKILSSYGIPVVKEKLVKSQNEAISAAEEIGYPVVLKGFSPTLTHKSEYGIIELNLKSEDEVKDAYQRINNNAKIKLNGMLVQEQIKGELELIIGLKKDLTFGPCVIFGLGGVFTEVLKDISIRVAPLDKIDAMEMINDIKGYKILEGYRGKKGVDIDKLCDILICVGEIGLKHLEIKEIDINPLIVEDGIPIAVDALIILEAN